MGKLTLYFVRHGQTVFNFENKVQGWSDSFLTPQGIEGVEKLAKVWQREGQTFDSVYSSDSGRTLQTSRIILASIKSRQYPIPTQGLREYNFGSFEGGSESELENAVSSKLVEKGLKLEETYTSNFSEYIDTIATIDKEKKGDEQNTWYSEDANQYSKRLTESITEIVNHNLNMRHENVLLVSHGMSIVTITALFCGDQITPAELINIANASVTTIVYENGKYKLESFAEIKK